jgi:hypothetical protein
MEDLVIFEGKEAIFLYNFLFSNGEYFVDIAFCDDKISDNSVKTVPYSKISFYKDKNDRKKNYLLKKEQERKNEKKKRAERNAVQIIEFIFDSESRDILSIPIYLN